jgi:hypothetical protein
MIEQPRGIKAPVAWLPAGLISWYGSGGLSVTLVTAWVALVGGTSPRLRTAWHGRHEPLSRFWTGGDFVLNVPHERDLSRIREVMSQGKLCLDAELDLGYVCASGVAVVAPRLLNCAVQIECVGGRLINASFETDLCGDVVRMHRGDVVINPADIPDLCAIHPLSPLSSL